MLPGPPRKTDDCYSTPHNALNGYVQPREIPNGYVNYEVGAVTLLVWGKNLTNQVLPQNGFGFPTVNPRVVTDPRTVLGTIRYSF